MADEDLVKSQDSDVSSDSSVHLSDEKIKDITAAIQHQDSDIVHAYLDDLSEADAADLISKTTEGDRHELFRMYGDSLDPYVFTELDPELQRQALMAMTPAQVATIISSVESDDALGLLQNLDTDFQQEVIHKLSAKNRVTLEEGLSFPEDSAGRLMQREVVAIPHFWTVGKTVDYLREAAVDLPEDFFDIFIIDPAYHVRGQIPLNKIIRAKRSEKIDSLSLEERTVIRATMDQEEVAHIFRRDNIISAPVTDDNGRLIGVITIDDIVDVIDEEAQEDILKLAGVETGDLYRAALTTTEARFRWLFINLLTAFLAAWVVSFFSETIDKVVALAALMPIVAGMGGNAGTQTLAVAVRALATRELSQTNAWRIIWKETLVGFLNGAAFAIITGAIAGLWFTPMIGVIIGMAMIINLICAGFFGIIIPLLLNRYGSDPAVSSTVVLTTVTDIVGFFAFLGLASLML